MVFEMYLFAVIIMLLVTLIFLVLRSKRFESKDIESAISSTWRNLGLDKEIGTLMAHSTDIRNSYRSIEQMLRVPKERASFGELALETIVSDQLPPDMYGIRKKIFEGKTPDAYINSTAGIICIDSKFPLDNYRKMCETSGTQKEDSKKQFKRDVRGHLEKVAADYVCPEKGSANFAFVYIPSEGVYYYLLSEEFQMLRDYSKKGIQVVSPLTLSSKLELIKAGVHAKKLSEDAGKVRDALLVLSRSFEEIDEKWQTFYNTHLRQLEGKAEELDRAYRKLRSEFDRISKMSYEE